MKVFVGSVVPVPLTGEHSVDRNGGAALGGSCTAPFDKLRCQLKILGSVVPVPLMGEHSVANTGGAFGAGRENRTLTLFPEPDFESGASTSSATPAWAGFRKRRNCNRI